IGSIRPRWRLAAAHDTRGRRHRLSARRCPTVARWGATVGPVGAMQPSWWSFQCDRYVSLQASSDENGGHRERHQSDDRQRPEAGEDVAERQCLEETALHDDQEMGEWNGL